MTVTAIAVPGLPEIESGVDLAALIADAHPIEDGDIVVVAQKVVSKSEGRRIDLSSVETGEAAVDLADQTRKDPRLVQVILDQSAEVLRAREDVLIVVTPHGYVCANAGVDASNVPGDEAVLLLPEDPDSSARILRSRLAEITGRRIAVIVTDSFGRAWRIGQQDIAIGCAGIDPLTDERGGLDREGRELTAAISGVADELASAANLARGKVSGEPVVILRGRSDLVLTEDGPGAAAAIRPRSEDLFR
jgi:coenzyme F420-0:L-glutamate ligase/coenzyme F420-1:gamma-L-glutamate ligase